MKTKQSIEYITITEAANRIGVCRMTVSRATAAGLYATRKVNKRPYLIWKNGKLLLGSEVV